MEWLKKHWSTAVTLGCVIIVALIEAWQQAAANLPANVHLPRLQGFWNYIPLILLIVGGGAWLSGRKKPGQIVSETPVSQPPSLPLGIPTLSSLTGQAFDPASVNIKAFFALAHYSPMTAEVEKNIKIIAQQNSPHDREAFYTRFIGVGLVAYQHDTTWFTIFRSQLEALAELNSRGLIPVGDLKKHYDKAVLDYPKTYSNYSFDQWLDYMKSRQIIARYPSGMVELSFGGKDFLKYLAHTGRDIQAKKN